MRDSPTTKSRRSWSYFSYALRALRTLEAVPSDARHCVADGDPLAAEVKPQIPHSAIRIHPTATRGSAASTSLRGNVEASAVAPGNPESSVYPRYQRL